MVRKEEDWYDEDCNFGEGDGGLMNDSVRGIPNGWLNSNEFGVSKGMKWDGAGASPYDGPDGYKTYRTQGFGTHSVEGSEVEEEHGFSLFRFFFGRHGN